MIGFDEFRELRLRSFVPAAQGVEELTDWTFRDERWVGEAAGLTEFLRREAEPDVLRSIVLHLEELADSVAHAVLDRLDLPLWPGIAPETVVERLGRPSGEVDYGNRRMLLFDLPAGGPYEVCCAFEPEEGLVLVSVLALAREEAR